MAGPTEVYVEAGDKRVFAGSIEWPGWCRTGHREDDALDALLALRERARAAWHVLDHAWEIEDRAVDG